MRTVAAVRADLQRLDVHMHLVDNTGLNLSGISEHVLEVMATEIPSIAEYLRAKQDRDGCRAELVQVEAANAAAKAEEVKAQAAQARADKATAAKADAALIDIASKYQLTPSDIASALSRG